MAYAKHVFQKGEILTADQMNHIENGIETLDTAMLSKVEAVTGKGLSTNDYTDAEKEKLAGLTPVPGAYVGASVTSFTSDGEEGLVPAPTFKERDNFLCGDGTWAFPSKLFSFFANSIFPTNIPNISEGYMHTVATEQYYSILGCVTDYPPLQILVRLEPGTYEDLTVYAAAGSLKAQIWYVNFVEALGEALEVQSTCNFIVQNLGGTTYISVRHKGESAPRIYTAPPADIPWSCRNKMYATRNATIAVRFYKAINDLADRIAALENAQA